MLINTHLAFAEDQSTSSISVNKATSEKLIRETTESFATNDASVSTESINHQSTTDENSSSSYEQTTASEMQPTSADSTSDLKKQYFLDERRKSMTFEKYKTFIETLNQIGIQVLVDQKLE